MHDPARDGSHHAYNTCGDEYAGQFDPIYDYIYEDPDIAKADGIKPLMALTIETQERVNLRNGESSWDAIW
jgi:hypothetical protein